MRMLLDVPSGWFVEPLRCGLTHYRDPERPAVRILVTSLVPLPADLRGWRMRELHALVPDEHQLAIVGERSAFSTLGWPLRVIEAECRRRGLTVERWLAVFYQPQDRIGVALVRGPRKTDMAAVWELLRAARPETSGRPARDVGGGLSGPIAARRN